MILRSHSDRATRLAVSVLAAGLWLATGSVLEAAALSEGVPYFTRVSGTVSVPAEISDHVMLVTVTINGQGPFRVIVDTGCSLTVISPQLAEAVHAKARDSDVSLWGGINGLGDVTDFQPVMLDTLDLGGAQFEMVPAVVSDTFTDVSAIDGRRIDGLLGYTLFHDLFLSLDVPNKRLLLSRDWPGGLPPVCTSLPVIEHGDVPFVNVEIQQKTVEVMVDTGANQALHLPPEIAAGLQWKTVPRIGELVAVVGEVAREQIGRLAGSLQLGSLQQVEPAAVISSGAPSLGLRSLENYCVVFHSPENRLWLCCSSAAPILPSPVRSVGLSLFSDQGGWRIAGVIPGSPAESAHLTPGELVTSLEGRPVTAWTRDQMNQWLDDHATLSLMVSDNSDSRRVTLPVWDLVP